MKKSLISPFVFKGRFSKSLFLLFLLINTIVLFNAVFHDPRIGYDAYSHLDYIRVLSKFRFPTPVDTPEFYSPPLYYLLPSFINSLFNLAIAAKFAQLLNFLFSIVLTFYFIKLCRFFHKDNPSFVFISLGFLAILPLYYKTFAFIRTEPLLSLLLLLTVYQTLAIFRKNRIKITRIILLGLLLGLLMLTRQSGLFMLLALVIFSLILVIRQREKTYFLRYLGLSLVIAFLIGGWFYLYLYRQYGTIAAFNRSPARVFSFSNQPKEFYFSLSLTNLFNDPIRKSFPNQFLPIFYSEVWGDYWSYFLVYGKDIRTNSFTSAWEIESPKWWLQTNRYDINKYLGRINIISLVPSSIFLAGLLVGLYNYLQFIAGRLSDKRTISYSLIFLIITITTIAYFYFLIMYPSLHKGDNIKAVYLFQIFPLISILAGEFLNGLKQKFIYIYKLLLILLIIIFLHNLPAFITRYIYIP